MRRLAAILLLALGSCVQPAQVYVTADRDNYDALAPAHAAYVRGDPSLDPIQKSLRFDVLASWAQRLSAAGQPPTQVVPEVAAILGVPR